MDYQRIYNALIESAQTQHYDNNTYYEIHHIKPASMCRISSRYGIREDFTWDIDADCGENLVRLTARQHYIAHILLAKIYPEMTIVIARWKERAKNSHLFSSLMSGLSVYRKNQYKNGTHNFCGLNQHRVNNSTHNFLKRSDGSSVSSDLQKKRIQEGSFHFQGSTGTDIAIRRNKKMILDGTHVSVCVKAKAKFAKTRQNRIDNNDWHTCGVRPWNNNSTKKHARYVWSTANVMYDLWINMQCGSRKLATLLKHKWSTSHDRIVKMFRDGWIPSLDSEWVRFQSSYGE